MMLTFLKKCSNASEDSQSQFDVLKMQQVKGYRFDFQKKIYLIHKKRKFWEVAINNAEVTYRAGVLRRQEEHKIIEVTKNYESNTLAKATVITKIAIKIEKGYYSTTAEKLPQPIPEKIPIKRKKRNEIQQTADTLHEPLRQGKRRQTRPRQKKQVQSTNNAQIKKKFWKGMEKNDELVQFQVIGNQLKITQKQADNVRFEIKTFSSFDQCIDHVHGEETFYAKQGFQPMKSSTFIQQQNKTTDKKGRGSTSNSLSKPYNSLINMTDNAMWQNSGVINDSEGQNVYLANSNLGPPINHCIKCLLAQNYKEETDPTGWIMSQKLDGVRCLWTGSQMFSRNGNKFNFPNFFTKNWPNSQLDGELFIGRGKFTQTLSAVRKTVPIATEWANLKYLVFDAPGLKQPFKTRIKVLEKQLEKIDNPYIKCHAHRPCEGFPDLFIELDKVNKAEGQGIMLRQPDALYENKRSKNLQKVKTFHDDEAEIIGYTDGTGRCLGWIGALRVRNGKGVEFEVGSGLNDHMRQNPPPVGAIITYKYQQFNKESGKPRFPTFLRMYEG